MSALSVPGVEVAGLRKVFGGHEALRGIDLTVPAGTVLGLLGPNGAGKTTTIRILSTLLWPDGGTARVAGFDVARQAREVRRRIGLTGQYAAVDELLSGRANLRLMGRLQHLGGSGARRTADELLERFDLADAADRPVGTYSGGMRRRLDLAASMVATPSVLFVDEPTTGLDPSSRRSLWEALRDLLDDGVTIVLTTQYLEEADELADSIAIIDQGEKVAEGTADELKRRVGGDRLVATAGDAAACRAAVSVLRGLTPGEPQVDPRQFVVTVQAPEGLATLHRATAALTRAGVDIRAISLRGPSLDEVFLRLTAAPATAA